MFGKRKSAKNRVHNAATGRHHRPLRLSFEQLEDRRVLASGFFFDPATGVMTIEGTAGNDNVTVTWNRGDINTKLDDKLVFNFNGQKRIHSQYFAHKPVSKIVFNGYNGKDTFRNGTGIKCEAHGGDGNDVLVGGSGADLLYGDNGHDKLYGKGGNDTLFGNAGVDKIYGDAGHDNLYGGSGNDFLYGGAGNDGLYGGGGVDVCRGDSGSDRFLHQRRDLVQNLTSSDARINFIEGGQATLGGTKYGGQMWTQREIEVVDLALATLHHTTGNTKLLKRADGSELWFHRQGNAIAKPAKMLNGWNDGKIIYMGNGSVPPDLKEENQLNAVTSTVFHEIGHHWDNTQKNTYFLQFMNLSGWIYSTQPPNQSFYTRLEGITDANWWHLKTAEFVGLYARKNPQEDWCDSFGHYWMQKLVGPHWGTRVDAKFELIQTFVASMV